MVNFPPKKLQVFVSSTYLDLIEERQAAVQAILSAGHIPAGMELFTAGDQSQWEVIKHWIDQSDVFLLILGGRYGSIEPETGKSYIHLEYEYALEKEIPVFSCVLGDPDTRAMDKGNINQYLERNNSDQYKKFKDLVTSKIVNFWDNSEKIKTSIILTLKNFEKRENIIGWVRGNQLINSNSSQQGLIEQLQKELEEKERSHNQKLQEVNENLQRHQQALTEKDSLITKLQEQIKQLKSINETPKTDEIELKSTSGIDYTKLRNLLAEGKWKEADHETTNIMFEAANQDGKKSLTKEDTDKFPCEDLQTIDKLWVKYSKGNFGFSVQKTIYIDVGGTEVYEREIWYEFCARIGWRDKGRYVAYDNLTFALTTYKPLTPKGHLPYWDNFIEANEWPARSSLMARLVTCKV